VLNEFSLQKEIAIYMDIIYYLASWIPVENYKKSLPKEHDFKFHDIKQDPITVAELEKCELSGSYEALFSKAQLYKSMDLRINR
jgi:arsenate reductase